ncbi:hypothetical protein DSECCO2_127900 [anaerobic digester metagenome]
MPRHTSLYNRFFNWYIKRILRSDFHDVRVVGDVSLNSTDSILLIPNHFSWWMVFLLGILTVCYFKNGFML